VWLDSRLQQLSGHHKALIISAPLHYGVYHLIDCYRVQGPLAWLELREDYHADDIGLGTALAETLNRALKTDLFHTALPYRYTLAQLIAALPYAPELTVAVSQAQVAPAFVTALMRLRGIRVICHFEDVPEELASEITLTQDDMRLSWNEAQRLSNERLDSEALRHLYFEVDGAYDLFMHRLSQLTGAPQHLLPVPEGLRPLEASQLLDPHELLRLLIRQKRWQAALELAVRHAPNEVPEILFHAGHGYHESGLHQRLYRLLRDLPAPIHQHEVVHFWRLMAAFRLGKEQALQGQTEAFLAQYTAANLQALYAGIFLPWQDAEKMAKKAYQQDRNAYTCFQYGRLIQNPEKAIPVLKESIQLAEQHGRPYEIARNADALAQKLMQQGRFKSAVSWSQWALEVMRKHSVTDGQRKLRIINTWAYNRILTGDTAGLEALLLEQADNLRDAYPTLARLFRSTLGDYYMAVGQPEQALVHYRLNFEQAERSQLGVPTLDLVRALGEMGEGDEALRIAQSTLALLRYQGVAQQAAALLAYGIVLLNQQPKTALNYLLRAESYYQTLHAAHRQVQVQLYLAACYQQLGDEEAVKEVLAQKTAVHALAQSGLRYLCGPEALFRDIFSRLSGNSLQLELTLFGQAELWLNQQRVTLHPQWLEIVAVLAIRQKPVPLEILMSDLYGDDGNKSTLKATLSKLRKVIPISVHPYSLSVPYQSDYQQVLSHIKNRNLTAAAQLYKGPLLSFSDAPFIREARDILESSLRNAALGSNDPDILLTLAEQFKGDLQLMEAACQALGKEDPRAHIVQARVEHIRREWLN
jgi:hypothetical protein